MPHDTRETDVPLALDDFVPYRLAVAADAVSKGLAAVYAGRFGITIPEWRIIANLGERGALTAGDAARYSSLDKVQVSRAVQRLVARRLVSRKQGREDRRQVRLALTAEGVRMLRDIAALALAWERDLLAPLPVDQRRNVMATLALITERARKAAAD